MRVAIPWPYEEDCDSAIWSTVMAASMLYGGLMSNWILAAVTTDG